MNWEQQAEPCPNCHHEGLKYYVAQEIGLGYCFHCQRSHKVGLGSNSGDFFLDIEKARVLDWGEPTMAANPHEKVLTPIRGQLPRMWAYGDLAKNNPDMFVYINTYLAKGDATMKELFKIYGCGLTPATEGPEILKNRFIYPVWNMGRIEGYQARGIYDFQTPKYWHPYKPFMAVLPALGSGGNRPQPKVDDPTAPFLITEGIKDAMRLSKLVGAIALLGNAITDEQLIYLAQELGTERRYYVALDENTTIEAGRIQAKLSNHGFKVSPIFIEEYSVFKDYGDFHDMESLRRMLLSEKVITT